MRFSNQFLPLFFISLIFVPVRFFLSLYLRQKKNTIFLDWRNPCREYLLIMSLSLIFAINVYAIRLQMLNNWNEIIISAVSFAGTRTQFHLFIVRLSVRMDDALWERRRSRRVRCVCSIPPFFGRDNGWKYVRDERKELLMQTRPVCCSLGSVK